MITYYVGQDKCPGQGIRMPSLKENNMKKTQKIIQLASLLFISVSCTESVNHLNIDTATTPTALVHDSTMIDPVVIEQKDADTLIPRKYIYLTIDDAPLNGSDYIDSVIAVAKVKTNIFLVGNSIDGSHRFRKYHEQMKENPYIAIYNHSYSHANNKYAKYYQNPTEVLSDFEKNRMDFNITHKIARLPGRNLWQIGERKKNYKQTGATSAELLVQNGYQVFGWDIEWKYNAKDYTPKQTIEQLIDEIEELHKTTSVFTSNHIVLLMHNQMFAKANDNNDLAKLIEKLKARNYTFEYLSTYPI